MTDHSDIPEEAGAAAEYALGLLSADEARAFEDVMSRDPAIRTEYAFWAENLVQLTDDVPDAEPGDHVWERIVDTAFGGETTPEKSWLARFGLPSALGGGLLAALAVLWLVDFSGVLRWLDPPAYTAEIVSEDNSLRVQASFDDDTGTLHLTRSAGAAVEGRALELWLISGGNAPISLGVMPETQTAEIVIEPAIVAALPDGVLAISDEPQGGSPTGAPTGAVLAVGPVIAL